MQRLLNLHRYQVNGKGEIHPMDGADIDVCLFLEYKLARCEIGEKLRAQVDYEKSDFMRKVNEIKCVNEHENLDQTEEQEFDWSYVDDSEQYYGWICQGDEDGYAYYTDPDGILYSVDQSGFWYFQDETDAEFQPCQETVVSIAMKMYPLNAHGQPVLPINAHGEKIFPTDANHMPIFPIDHSTQLPTFPVDDYGQPVFPTGTDGRPIVPVDGNGVPVLPRDATGKPVIPYDDHGMPLIHLASDGITPLTEEEYQYSLQWHDYYGSYNQYYALVHNPIQPQQVAFGVPSLAMGVNTLEQAPERSLKFLKKVRPEDIDLPLTALPPQPSDAVPISMTPDCAKPQPEPPLAEEVEQQKAAEELKAKTKRLMEMQLRFTRKTPGFGIAAKTNTTDSVGKKKSEESKTVGEKDSNENDSGDKTANDSMDESLRSVELNGNAYDMMTANESVADNTEASTTPKAASPETVPAPNDVRSTTSPGDTNHPSMELDTQNEESNETTTTLEPALNHDDNQAISVEEKSAQMVETNQSSLNENENEDSGRPTISNGKESAAVDNEAVLFVETSEADPKKLSQPKSLPASSKPESLPASQNIPSLSKPSNEERSVSKAKSDPLGDILNEYPISTRSNSSLSNVSQNERQHGQISSHRPAAASSHSRQEPSRDQEPPQSQHSKESNNHQYDHESRNSRSRSSTYPRYLYESPSPEIHHSSYQSPKQQEPASSRSPNRPYSGSKSPNRSVRESRTRHHSKHERSSSRTQRHVRREKSSRKRSRSCSPSRSVSRTQSSRRAGWEHSEHSSNRRHHSLAESRSRELSPHDQSVSREPERSTSLERSGSVSSVQSSNLSITILSNSGKPSTRIVRSSTHSKHSTEQHQNRSPGEISSITQQSENGEQIRSQMNSKETKKDRKKKHRKQSSSSRRSRKIGNLEASGTLSAKKNGREAVEQTVEDLVSRENDLEREKDGAKQDSNSYGPQPPKQVTAEDAETDDHVKGLKTKDSKSKKVTN
ncbi:unnamed protein product [Anisakis simplex]|uniref:Cuticle protein n=1 Tax=Anisakis simplex TaxID=6269 RepID=A0A0M3K425_ANISI|nr:unnamed protein product [Anisakis simplex]